MNMKPLLAVLAAAPWPAPLPSPPPMTPCGTIASSVWRPTATPPRPCASAAGTRPGSIEA